MKRIAIASALLIAIIVSPEANGQVGIAAGLNFEKLGDIKATDRQATFDNSTGYHVGLFFDLGAGPVSLRPGIYYRDMGDVTLTDGLQSSTFDMSLIEVPFDIRVNVIPSPVVSPYLFGGPVVAFASSSDQDFNDAVRNLLLSANAGVGVNVSLGSVTLSPELRFGFTVNRWLEEDRMITVGSATIVADDIERQSAVMLRLGIAF